MLTRENLDRLLWNAQAAPAQPQAAPISWWQRFICDIRVTDVALMGFALFLLLAIAVSGRLDAGRHARVRPHLKSRQ